MLTCREAMAGCCGGRALLGEGVRGAIVDQLAAQIARLVPDPLTRDKLRGIALEPLSGSTPDEFAAFVRAEVDRWTEIVRNSGAALE